MNTNEIAKVVLRNMAERQFSIFMTTFQGQGIHEADVFGINKNGYMYEYEIKRSRSDFRADFTSKETKHRHLKERDAVRTYDEWHNGKKTGAKKEIILIPNRFFFVCEEGLLTEKDMPEYAGLLILTDNKKFPTRELKSAPLLHKNKANSAIYERVATMLCQRSLYGCSFYNYQHNIIHEFMDSLPTVSEK